MRGPTLSVVIPTYRRERVLIETLTALMTQLQHGDEMIVIDQTESHEAPTRAALAALATSGRVRWVTKGQPNQAEAMNLGGRLATGEVLLFLDDDIVPSPVLLESHRAAFTHANPPPATCGQVLQPWHAGPIDRVADFDLCFDAAYAHACEITTLMAGNFAIRRDTFLDLGGIDEHYHGYNYRIDAEMAYRIWTRTGGKVRFVPAASVRHLMAGGGNRAFGARFSWGGISSSVGDYYFAMKWLPAGRVVRHHLHRFRAESINRYTVTRPWLIPSIMAREVVAWVQAANRLRSRHDAYIRPLAAYIDVHEHQPDPEPV